MEYLRDKEIKQIINYQRALKRERIFKKRIDPLENYSDFEFKSRFRLNKISLQKLAELLRDRLERATERSQSLPVHLQLAVGLRFYVKGIFACNVTFAYQNLVLAKQLHVLANNLLFWQTK